MDLVALVAVGKDWAVVVLLIIDLCDVAGFLVDFDLQELVFHHKEAVVFLDAEVGFHRAVASLDREDLKAYGRQRIRLEADGGGLLLFVAGGHGRGNQGVPVIDGDLLRNGVREAHSGLDHIAALPRERVEHQDRRAVDIGVRLISDGLQAVVLDIVEQVLGQFLVVVGDLILIRDGGTRKHVVELVDEDLVPRFADVLAARVRQDAQPIAQGAGLLCFFGKDLVFAVVLFDARPGGVGAAVVFKVHFAFHRADLAQVFRLADAVEILCDGCHLDICALHSVRAVLLENPCILAGIGAAAVVAIAHHAERFFHAGLFAGLLVALEGVDNLAVAVDVDIVLHRRIGQDFGAVDGLPLEDVGIALGVLLLPVELRGDEVVHAGLLQDLRELPVKAECIRHIADRTHLVEFPLEEALAFQALADQSFAAGEVQVRLDHLAAGVVPLPVGDELLDVLIHLRVVFLGPLIVLRSGHGELVVLVALQVCDCAVERITDDIARGVLIGPLPCGIDVCVRDQVHGPAAVDVRLRRRIFTDSQCLGHGRSCHERRKHKRDCLFQIFPFHTSLLFLHARPSGVQKYLKMLDTFPIGYARSFPFHVIVPQGET